MKGVEQPPEFHPEGDVWTHTLMMLERAALAQPDAGAGRAAARRRQAAHLPRGGPHPLRRARGAGRADGGPDPEPAALLQRGDPAGGGAGRQPSALQGRAEDAGEHAEALPAPGNASRSTWSCTAWIAWPATAGSTTTSSCKRKTEELPREELKPRPLITGHDLIAAGYQPGPAFARMLAAVEDAQLEGQVRTPDEAMSLVRSRFQLPDGRPTPAGS